MLTKVFAGLTIVVCLALAGAAALGTFSSRNDGSSSTSTQDVQPTPTKSVSPCCGSKCGTSESQPQTKSCCED
jgi:hypothetical protein